MGGKRVVILGGGVAGMSAAHELVERGFEVHVYEMKDLPGGKARSIPVPHSGTEGRPDLPGEHGFRFFPRFYRHVTDTMKRIPYGTNGNGVFDNLVQTTRIDVTRSEVLLARAELQNNLLIQNRMAVGDRIVDLKQTPCRCSISTANSTTWCPRMPASG